MIAAGWMMSLRSCTARRFNLVQQGGVSILLERLIRGKVWAQRCKKKHEVTPIRATIASHAMKVSKGESDSEVRGGNRRSCTPHRTSKSTRRTNRAPRYRGAILPHASNPDDTRTSGNHPRYRGTQRLRNGNRHQCSRLASLKPRIRSSLSGGFLYLRLFTC
jgi:hypothetical protein